MYWAPLGARTTCRIWPDVGGGGGVVHYLGFITTVIAHGCKGACFMTDWTNKSTSFVGSGWIRRILSETLSVEEVEPLKATIQHYVLEHWL